MFSLNMLYLFFFFFTLLIPYPVSISLTKKKKKKKVIRQNIIPQILSYGLGTCRLMSSKVLNANSILEVGNMGKKVVK